MGVVQTHRLSNTPVSLQREAASGQVFDSFRLCVWAGKEMEKPPLPGVAACIPVAFCTSRFRRRMLSAPVQERSSVPVCAVLPWPVSLCDQYFLAAPL